MINQLIKIEKELDEKITNLSIWKLPYQHILTVLLYNVENIDFSNRGDTAMDYLGRLSHIYPLIKKYAKESNLVNSSQALVETTSYMEDINFLNAYAHFCQLMPQIHRGTITAINIKEKKITLDYPSDEIKHSELIDRLYSYISLHVIYSFNNFKGLEKYTDAKVSSGETNINANDLAWIKNIYTHHKHYFFNVQILPDKVFKESLGFTYKQYISYSAALRAFSDYFITLGRSYRKLAIAKKSDNLMNEYFEWSVCCLNFKFLGFFQGMSGLQREVFDKILTFHLNIISNTTGETFKSKGFCGDGFCPPITLLQNSIIFSPLALRFNLNINNILFSLNKNDKKIFDEKISESLEPTLIKQMEYLFSRFNNIKISKNLNYSKSEIDFIVLSKKEKVCLLFQVKTTIAPDSARTVSRVESRVTEALKQIKCFDDLPVNEKNEIINREFKTNLDEINYQNIIMVRSSAGSEKSWAINKKFRIVNYTFLAKILCEKLKSRNFDFSDFSNEILSFQDDMIKKSNWKVNNETLKIDDYEIQFPDITYDNIGMMKYNLESKTCFNKMEQV